jgi:hypothetical protein
MSFFKKRGVVRNHSLSPEEGKELVYFIKELHAKF